MEKPAAPFQTPEEEISYLRAELARRESAIKHPDQEKQQAVGREVLRDYEALPHETVRTPNEQKPTYREVKQMQILEKPGAVVDTDPVLDVMEFIKKEGIKRGLELLQKRNEPHVTDAVHDRLIEELRAGVTLGDIRENDPLYEGLHMMLFEVTVAQDKGDEEKKTVRDILDAMQRFLSGMEGVAYGGKQAHYTIEVAVAEGGEDIVFYVAVPSVASDLFEKQLLSLFPYVSVSLVPHDYTIFNRDSVAVVSTATLDAFPIYPLLKKEENTTDPLSVLINALTKIEKEHAGGTVQFIVSARPRKDVYKTYEGIMERVQKGEDPKLAIQESTLGGTLWSAAKGMFATEKSKEEQEKEQEKTKLSREVDIEQMHRKLQSPITDTTVRIVASGASVEEAERTLRDIESAFNQFSIVGSNTLIFERNKGASGRDALRDYVFRNPSKKPLPLSYEEIASLIHFPQQGRSSTSQLKQTTAKRAPAPLTMGTTGMLLGVNDYQGKETQVFVTPEDRLRHFYVIGQTGTGKTTILKNMIVQDIQNGEGVCMIDPHGTDIADIMGSIPPERYGDVIYFDPGNLSRSMGLNILEYDLERPEQKTFVVNELFSIFKKLYSEESMGPMFEQYFRNAALLVLEDPESGSTLFDISRIFADADFRNYKLSKAKNPVVVQFWNDIALKAGGEASLENIVPYITSKVDTFTANDYMRPIIGQQHSSFDFRKLMDEKKIFLVNLSKGRIGELNANLLGMVIIGKFLMAALSRVDDPTRGFPPFYLYMDEFQNISTDSISQILSEARKYKLSLNVAHQFIAQLDEGIKNAVFGNVGNMAVFRVGAEDAAFLEKYLAPQFTAADIGNIENYNAYVRMLVNGTPTNPFSLRTLPPPESDETRMQALIEYSSIMYGRPREEVEEEIMRRYRR